jgi:glyoxylase-like metal-dependent hydrolase (beta-lactamase superfamily II)
LAVGSTVHRPARAFECDRFTPWSLLDTRFPMLPTIDTPLRYEFEKAPGMGEIMEVSEGIFWLRMPLPIMLGHINLWLLRDQDSWVIVDSGMSDETTRGLWLKLFEEKFRGLPVSRVIVTHLHPDHVGLAGWLCRHWGVELWMSRTEYLLCRNLVRDTGTEAPGEGVDFYRRAGFDEESLAEYRKRFGGFGSVVSDLPNAFTRLTDGMQLTIGGETWEVVIGRGHSPEHACLYCPSRKLIISGDQILPTISSNVSVWPTEPHANPLADWLDSCASLKQRLPADVLVLPSHGKIFRGAPERLQALIDEHQGGLDKLLEMCDTPRTVIELFPALFKSVITRRNLIMATGESQAHVNYLLGRGELELAEPRDGVNYYRRT